MSASSQKIYGLPWINPDPVKIELAMIRGWGYQNVQGKKYGNGLAFHLMALQKLLWPDKDWHRWNRDLIIPEIARTGTTAIWGPGSSGKTHEISDFILALYFAFPRGLTCICSTTTTDMLDFRIFGQMKMRLREAKERFPWLPGHVVASKHMIVTDPGDAEDRDFRDGIKGVACIQGSTWKGLGNYVGIKNKIMVLAADECSLMQQGFLKAAANLKLNPVFFGIYTGNLSDLNNPLAEVAEPEFGWDSIPDTELSRVYKTKLKNGRAVQLIGTDSPNFDFPAGKEPYPHLIGRAKIAEAEVDYGRDTPLFNMFAKGKIPRDTMENRVISELVCSKFDAFEPVTWGSEPIKKLYCADISYTIDHGDRTCGMPLAYGKDVHNEWRIAPLDKPLTYALSALPDKGTPEEQIALLMKAECERFGIEPSCVFYDGTGRSSFTSAIMRLWSTSVNAVECGGKATVRPNFINRRYKDDNQRMNQKKGELVPCNEVFEKLITEYWFAWRYAVEARQVRNLSPDIVKEGQRRIWLMAPGNKMEVEPKKEMKLRTGRSPDLADMWCIGLEGARRMGFPLGKLATEQTKPRTEWLSKSHNDFKSKMRERELSYN